MLQDRNHYLIIDGQQRLTTISILVIAIRNIAIENDDDFLPQECNRLLTSTNSRLEETKLKLKPNKTDNDYFKMLFDCEYEKLKNNESNIINNYKFFIQSSKMSS